MSDSEDWYWFGYCDMNEDSIENQIINEQIDLFLSVSAERMLHGGGTPPNLARDENINTTLEINHLYFQPIRNGKKLPLRMCNYNKQKRQNESEKFDDFLDTLIKDEYDGDELNELYNNFFLDASISKKAMGQLKTIKNAFIVKRKQIHGIRKTIYKKKNK